MRHGVAEAGQNRLAITSTRRRGRSVGRIAIRRKGWWHAVRIYVCRVLRLLPDPSPQREERLLASSLRCAGVRHAVRSPRYTTEEGKTACRQSSLRRRAACRTNSLLHHRGRTEKTQGECRCLITCLVITSKRRHDRDVGRIAIRRMGCSHAERIYLYRVRRSHTADYNPPYVTAISNCGCHSLRQCHLENMKTAYISGHLKISNEEFAEHYVPKLAEALERGDSFVLGDARGVDQMTQDYLVLHTDKIKVYHMFEKPRNCAPGLETVGSFKSDEERDAAMTAASDYDIAWVRPGREDSGTARNLKRRQ